jgi:hypothetical protein
MATQLCFDRIKAKGGVYCNTLEANFCVDIQTEINEYCTHNSLETDTPVIQKVNGQKCYCCCSCFAFDTPIEVTPGEFKFIQDIWEGDTVLATGADGETWVERKVTLTGGLAPGYQLSFMYYTAFQLNNEAREERYIICTADHLFLLPNGKLLAIQDLVPGDEVRAADGGIATVIFAVPGQYDRGVRHIGLGEWNPGDPLDGHLLNSNGLITADLIVQLNYYGGDVPPELLEQTGPDDRLSPGSPAYMSRYPVEAMMDFIGDKDAWPLGFQPHMQPLINIPEGAHRYFTEKQSEEINENSKMWDYGNSVPISTSRYLFKIYGAFYAGFNFVIDWNRELPNAYFFEDFGQKYIVLTGGLLRNMFVDRDGVAIVLSHLMAVNQGHTCVGVADYYGIYLYLREVWNDDLFIDVYDRGMFQIENLFGAITDKDGDPANHCKSPGIDCRLEALKSGVRMGGVPACAKEQPEFFVVSATASDNLKFVTAVFNKKLDPPTAKSKENYTIEPGVEVTEAVFTIFKPKQVKLKVSGLEKGTEYKLSITELLDEKLTPISPEGNTAVFKTSDDNPE